MIRSRSDGAVGRVVFSAVSYVSEKGEGSFSGRIE